MYKVYYLFPLLCLEQSVYVTSGIFSIYFLSTWYYKYLQKYIETKVKEKTENHQQKKVNEENFILFIDNNMVYGPYPEKYYIFTPLYNNEYTIVENEDKYKVLFDKLR